MSNINVPPYQGDSESADSGVFAHPTMPQWNDVIDSLTYLNTKVGTGVLVLDTTDSSGTPGAATIAKPSGKSAFKAAESTLVITNSLVGTGTKVFFSLERLDGTLGAVAVVCTANTITFTGTSTATATTKINWFIIN